MLAEIFGVDMIIVIVVAAVLLFGAAQIPKLARSLGSARREFDAGLKAQGTDPTSKAATAFQPANEPE
jgi:TatA/E family protein of Tat protein translocase